jgi:predicted RNA-binding protein
MSKKCTTFTAEKSSPNLCQKTDQSDQSPQEAKIHPIRSDSGHRNLRTRKSTGINYPDRPEKGRHGSNNLEQSPLKAQLDKVVSINSNLKCLVDLQLKKYHKNWLFGPVLVLYVYESGVLVLDVFGSGVLVLDVYGPGVLVLDVFGS